MISGQNVVLVPFQQQHVKRSREWFNDPELAGLLNRTSTITTHEHNQWFQSLSKRDDLLYFAIEEKSSGEHVGNIWLADIDNDNRRAELRIVIGASSSMSRGMGSESMTLLCKYAFETMKFHRVYAFVLEVNPRAKRAFEKAGFEVEGVLREDRWTGERYADVYLLAKLSGRADSGSVGASLDAGSSAASAALGAAPADSPVVQPEVVR